MQQSKPVSRRKFREIGVCLGDSGKVGRRGWPCQREWENVLPNTMNVQWCGVKALTQSEVRENEPTPTQWSKVSHTGIPRALFDCRCSGHPAELPTYKSLDNLVCRVLRDVHLSPQTERYAQSVSGKGMETFGGQHDGLRPYVRQHITSALSQAQTKIAASFSSFACQCLLAALYFGFCANVLPCVLLIVAALLLLVMCSVTHMLPRRTPLAVLLLLLPASILATTQTLSALRGASLLPVSGPSAANATFSRRQLEEAGLLAITGTAHAEIEDNFEAGVSVKTVIVTAADGQLTLVSNAPALSTFNERVNWLVRPKSSSERNPTQPLKYLQAWFERALPVPAQAADGTAQLPAAGQPIDLHGRNNVLFIRVGLIDAATGANLLRDCDETCMTVRPCRHAHTS